MSKRKAGVSDIIYELDNDDVVSSDDEQKTAKINRLHSENEPDTLTAEASTLKHASDDPIIESPTQSTSQTETVNNDQNGGKSEEESIQENNKIIEELQILEKPHDNVDGCISVKDNDVPTSVILNEDMDLKSPSSNSDPGVVGCENRTPLVTFRFRDSKYAKKYKSKLKEFMLNLIKLHDESSLTGSETETDLELDIWPEDLNETIEEQPQPEEDSLFFVDTDPGFEELSEIPRYRQGLNELTNKLPKEPTPPPVLRRGPTCFNCDGPHALRECSKPRNNARIAEKRRNMMPKLGRYHVEDEQKYGHLSPGRISGQLRHALGLKRYEIPLYIYRMRLLGYPPGWLEEARISHSGITMFDSSGTAIQDPEDEEGEVNEPGSKDKFDIKKILDFPGFNVPASSRYKEEAHMYGLPPISDQDSKIAMLQMLAPNAMKAYKRKKLTYFPSATNTSGLEGQAEMELDSGDEIVEFPSIPPLPDEAPPPAPPPPPPPAGSPPPPPPPADEDRGSSDVEIIEVLKVKDIPVPDSDLIVLDEVDDANDEPTIPSCNSPSLDDLEAKKRLLLNALAGDSEPTDSGTEIVIDSVSDSETKKIVLDSASDSETKKIVVDSASDSETKKIVFDSVSDSEAKNNDQVSSNSANDSIEISTEKGTPIQLTSESTDNKDKSDSDSETKLTNSDIKSTLYGTPVLNIASPFVKLPSDEKFSKDICDVINFENLPNSTGKYKKISSLLKKVKNEVDRIQES